MPQFAAPSTAQSRDQAAILFALAAKVVRMSPRLDAVLVIRETVKQIYLPRPWDALPGAEFGDVDRPRAKSPIFAVHDELGQVRGPVSELYNAIENAMGAHDAPLSIIISTQAPTDADLLSILIDDALTGRDPYGGHVLYTADADADPFSVKALRQANPAYGDFLNPKEVRNRPATPRRCRPGVAVSQLYAEPAGRQIDRRSLPSRFGSRTAQRPADDWGQAEVYSGLDLVGHRRPDRPRCQSPRCSRDFGMASRRSGFPAPNLREKSRADRVPYDLWHETGFSATRRRAWRSNMSLSPSHLFAFDQTHNWKRCAFDRWAMKFLRPWLVKAGFTEATN